MEYEFFTVPEGKHLHAIGNGTHSSDNLRRFLADTHQVVVRDHWDAVLLEMNFNGPSLDVGSLYGIIFERHLDAAELKRIAYVDKTREHLPERAEFAELAANKLGVNARVFATVDDARRWLDDTGG